MKKILDNHNIELEIPKYYCIPKNINEIGKNFFQNIIIIYTYIYIFELDSEKFISELEKSVKYPVIVKTVEASAVSNSHKMAIVLSRQGLKECV